MAARWARSGAKNKGETWNGAAGGGGDGSEPERQIKGEAASDTEAGLPDLQAFLYGANAVRAVEKDGDAWFVAQDVCDVLGIVNSRDATDKLDDDERSIGLTDTPGGRQKVVIIREGGVMYLILRSRKPEARVFRRWVTDVVLPSILRTGSYSRSAPDSASSPHITLPGPGRYIAHMTGAGQVTCVLASNEEAAARIYFAAGRLMAHTLKVIRAHWSIVKQSEVFEDAPRPAPGAAALGRAIAEGDRLATDFLPLWNTAAGSRA